jgi:hypothetical protein
MSKLDRTLDSVGKGVNRVQIGCWTIFFNLFFAGFCLWGVYAAYTGWQLQTQGERTTGTVIEMEESSSVEGGCCVYSPVVEFQVNGQSYTFDGSNASDPPPIRWVRKWTCSMIRSIPEQPRSTVTSSAGRSRSASFRR